MIPDLPQITKSQRIYRCACNTLQKRSCSTEDTQGFIISVHYIFLSGTLICTPSLLVTSTLPLLDPPPPMLQEKLQAGGLK